MKERLNAADGHIPAWVDKARLCQEICACDATIDAWVKLGILPPARKRGGKLMWKWAEVDKRLEDGPPGVQSSADQQGDAIYDATRNAVAAQGSPPY